MKDLTQLEKAALSDAGRHLVSASRKRKGSRIVAKLSSTYGRCAYSFMRSVHSLMQVYRITRVWLLAAPHMIVPPEELRNLVEKAEAHGGGRTPKLKRLSLRRAGGRLV